MVRRRWVIAFDHTEGHTTVGRTPLDEGSWPRTGGPAYGGVEVFSVKPFWPELYYVFDLTVELKWVVPDAWLRRTADGSAGGSEALCTTSGGVRLGSRYFVRVWRKQQMCGQEWHKRGVVEKWYTGKVQVRSTCWVIVRLGSKVFLQGMT